MSETKIQTSGKRSGNDAGRSTLGLRACSGARAPGFASANALRALLLLIFLGFAFAAPASAASSSAPLADAAERQDTAAVASLIERGADPDASQADGMTALLWAAYHDDLSTARALIEAGADVEATNRYGVAPLSVACTNGNGQMVRLLLTSGADPNTALRGGETALMTASRTGRLDAVEALLAYGAKVDATERRGQTALMWAAAEGHVDVVDALIEAGADFRRTLDSGFTPLMFAVREGRAEVVRRLLDAGADVNKPMTKADGGHNKPDRNMSPLMMAIENGHFELAVALLEAGADPNDARTGFTPLMAVSWVRKPRIGDSESGLPPPRGSGRLTSLQFVRKLVEHGADVNLQKSDNRGGRRRISAKGTTPFLCAAAKADVDYMKTLLELGADPTIANAKGQNGLMMAAGIDESPEADGAGTKDEHLAAVKFLLDLGVYDIDATADNGETAMHGAAYKMLPRVVHLLDEHGADIEVWAKKSKEGRTPLSIAQGYRPGNFKPSPETIAAIEEVMCSHGVTPPPPPDKEPENY